MFHSAADTVGDGIENIINNIGEELEDIRHGFHELDSSRKMQRKFVKPLNSDSVVDMLWDTPKSQHPELIQAARSKVNFEQSESGDSRRRQILQLVNMLRHCMCENFLQRATAPSRRKSDFFFVESF